jgi:hypothetical protein
MRPFLLFIMIVCTALSACAGAPATTPAVVSPRVPSATPFMIQKRSPIPSRFAIPSPNYSPTIPLIPLATDSPTAEIRPFDNTATAVEATREAPFIGTPCAYAVRQLGSISPDGKWVFCEDGTEVVAIQRNGPRWTFSMSDFFGESGWNYGVLPIYWTRDGAGLFFAPVHIVDSAFEIPYNIYFALMYMDLNLGKVNVILPLKNGFDTYYLISISPTGRRLVYHDQTHRDSSLTVRDLKTNAEYSWVDNSDFVSGFSWSADGTELRYFVQKDGGIYWVRVDVQNNALPVLYAITPEPISTINP